MIIPISVVIDANSYVTVSAKANYYAQSSATANSLFSAVGTANYTGNTSITGTSSSSGSCSANHACLSSVAGLAVVTASAKANRGVTSGITGDSTATASCKAQYAATSNSTGTSLVTAGAKAHYTAQSGFIGLAVVTANAEVDDNDHAALSGSSTFSPGTPEIIRGLTTSLMANSSFGILMTVVSRVPNTPINVPIPIVRTVPQPPPTSNYQIQTTPTVKSPPVQTGTKVKAG